MAIVDRSSGSANARPKPRAVLGWVAACGWWPTVAAIVTSPGWYGALMRGSALPLALLGLWGAAVLTWVVWQAVTQEDTRSSKSRQEAPASSRRLRAFGAVVVALAVAWSAQQTLTAGAAAVHAGGRSTFVGRTLSQSGRSAAYIYGTWGPNNNRRAYLMDEQPLLGEHVSISTPPLGGWEVYSGGIASSLLLVVYLAILLCCSYVARRLLKPRVRQRGKRPGRA